MSAKWRRSKKRSKWFNIIKNIEEDKGKNISKAFRIENLRKRKRSYPRRYRLPKISKKKKWKEPEPLVDILEEEDRIIVVAEFIGFEKEKLKIQAKDNKLILSAEATDRKYHKSLNLPKIVIPSSMNTTYKNGVLQIRLKKAIEEKLIDKVAG